MPAFKFNNSATSADPNCTILSTVSEIGQSSVELRIDDSANFFDPFFGGGATFSD